MVEHFHSILRVGFEHIIMYRCMYVPRARFCQKYPIHECKSPFGRNHNIIWVKSGCTCESPCFTKNYCIHLGVLKVDKLFATTMPTHSWFRSVLSGVGTRTSEYSVFSPASLCSQQTQRIAQTNTQYMRFHQNRVNLLNTHTLTQILLIQTNIFPNAQTHSKHSPSLFRTLAFHTAYGARVRPSTAASRVRRTVADADRRTSYRRHHQHTPHHHIAHSVVIIVVVVAVSALRCAFILPIQSKTNAIRGPCALPQFRVCVLRQCVRVFRVCECVHVCVCALPPRALSRLSLIIGASIRSPVVCGPHTRTRIYTKLCWQPNTESVAERKCV